MKGEAATAKKTRPSGKRVKRGAPTRRPRRIVALLCENSAFIAYEGVSGRAELKGVEAVRLPCAGRADAGLILRLLEKGAAGVVVVGCPRDDCSYVKGNCRAEKRVASVQKALREAGLNDAMVRMAWASSVDERALVDAVAGFKRSI
jgi:F420-non-reducing hydrogenase iron-sulfur subunit